MLGNRQRVAEIVFKWSISNHLLYASTVVVGIYRYRFNYINVQKSRTKCAM